MRPLHVLLAILFLFAPGCLGVGGDDAVTASGTEAPDDAPEDVPPTPAGEAAAEPAAEPAETAAAEDEEALEEPAPTEPRVVVLEATADATLAVGLPCVSEVRPCSRGPVAPATLDLEEGGSTKATLTVWWNATLPEATVGRIELRKDARGIVEAEGESPITTEVPLAALAEPASLAAWFGPATGNVAVQDEAHVVLVLEYA